MGGGQSIDYMTPVSKPKEGQTAIYRSPSSAQKLVDGFGEFKTMKDIIINTANKFKARQSLGTIIQKDGKPDHVQYISYYQLLQKAKYVGSGIINRKLAFQSEQGDMNFVAIFSRNRPQWTIVDITCMIYKLVTIPIYDTLGDQNITYVLEQTKLTTCFVNKDGISALIKTKDLANLKTLVSFDEIDQADRQNLKQRNVEIIYFGDLMEQGKKNVIDFKAPEYKVTPNDIMTFSYTSGTTGPPKGAMLSHGNLAAACGAVANKKQMNFNQNDIAISYLPLPHVLQRQLVCSMLTVGARIVYFSGNVQKISLDLALVKPTIFVSVPRLYSKFYDVIQQKFADVPEGWTKSILQRGLNAKLQNANKNGSYSHSIYDRVCFKKTKQVLGGRCRLMISGSAPLRPEVQQFLKCVLCAPLYEGYGQTETTGAATITGDNDPQCGIIGGPVDHTQVKLVDIPDMNYTSKDKNSNGQPTPRGEIWMRGPAIFKGYYKNHEKTKEAITEDGWVKSGDVGMILPGTHALKIIDRKKNIFKLQQGEYVAPQKVEKVYVSTDNFVDVFLHGDSTETFAVAIVEPQRPYMQKLLKSLNIEGKYEQVCNNKQVRMAILKQMNKATKAQGVKSFQQAKNVFVEPGSFQLKGIVTNTMKIQRHEAKRAYENQIKQMYAEGMLPVK